MSETDIPAEGGSGGNDYSNSKSKRHLQDVRAALRRGYIDLDQAAAMLPKEMASLVKDGKPRQKIAAARVIVQMVGQVQADEHVAEKFGRIDAGQATERIEAKGIVVEFVGPRPEAS